MLKVSVIVPTYKRSQSVERLLEALNNQTFPDSEFEVVVSIDGSEDGTREMVRGFEATYSLSYIWEQNSGRASACNRGIHKAQGELLIILDDDMEPSTGFIEGHYKAHSAQGYLGVIGAAPIPVDESSEPAVRYTADRFNSRFKRMSDPGYKFRIWDFYSGNFSIMKTDMIKAGSYSESFKGYGHEDIELAYRLLKEGIEIVYDHQAMSIQHNNDNIRDLANKYLSSGKNVLLFTRIHPDTFSQFELSSYNSSGWKWRAMRLALINLSMLCSVFHNFIVSSVYVIDLKEPDKQNKLYELLLDYTFWLGVWSAAAEVDDGKQIISKIKSFRE